MQSQIHTEANDPKFNKPIPTWQLLIDQVPKFRLSFSCPIHNYADKQMLRIVTIGSPTTRIYQNVNISRTIWIMYSQTSKMTSDSAIPSFQEDIWSHRLNSAPLINKVQGRATADELSIQVLKDYSEQHQMCLKFLILYVIFWLKELTTAVIQPKRLTTYT